MTGREEAPNPGSREACDLGCLCAVLDNNHGKFPINGDWSDPWWYVTVGCPVHVDGWQS